MKVFLSSTAGDLTDYRRVVEDTLVRLSHQVIGMERLGPKSGMPADECERLAADCDLLICVVAHRFGHEPQPGRGSVTQREVMSAHRAGKPILAWIVDDGFAWTEAKEQDRLTDAAVLNDPQQIAQVVAAVRGLESFRSWLASNFVVERFTTPDDLGRKVSLAVKAHTGLGLRSTARAPAAEIRITHALQPAPNFTGREPIVGRLLRWIDDSASQDRVHAIVAPGGTGKTAIVEQVLARLRTGGLAKEAGSVLVWSFYERPDSSLFLRECASLFLGEVSDVNPGGRLDRVQRGLADGRSHLLLLDGLGRGQVETAAGRTRGGLEDVELKLLLQAVANGLGRTRALVTSRFPLTDLRDWTLQGYQETFLSDLSVESARELMRGWGVLGTDAQIDCATEQVGRHALSVAVLGSYLNFFAEGKIESIAEFNLDTVQGDDPKAAKLARVLAFYAERLPQAERDLLARLSVFPRGIPVDSLDCVAQAGVDVAGGIAASAHEALFGLLKTLQKRGLVFGYASGDAVIYWTAHPFVRERFAALLGCPTAAVFDAVARGLVASLDLRPDRLPYDVALLDKYEQFIEASVGAGNQQVAFDAYWHGLGGYAHVGKVLGDYGRGYRVLSCLVRKAGDFDSFGDELEQRSRSIALSDFAGYAMRRGNLLDAWQMRQLDDRLMKHRGQPDFESVGLQNTAMVALALGRLPAALKLAELAQDLLAKDRRSGAYGRDAASLQGIALHGMGKVEEARASFSKGEQLKFRSRAHSLRLRDEARHHLDLEEYSSAERLAAAGLTIAQDGAIHLELARWHLVFARMKLGLSEDPGPYLSKVRDWILRTDDAECVAEWHLLSSLFAIERGDTGTAREHIESGLLRAKTCGFRLLQIELLITSSRYALLQGSIDAAIGASSSALVLAQDQDCCFAWGEANAAHSLGVALAAASRLAPARQALDQALNIRRRIQHPQAAHTQREMERLL